MVSLEHQTTQEQSPKLPDGERLNFVPPLKDGDRLDAVEFLSRYEATPEGQKAELINGMVVMLPPTSTENHGQQDNLAQTWLGVYSASTPGTRPATNSTIKLGSSDVPQPDGLLRILPEFGGQTMVEDRILHGPPELGFEVAASSASLDANQKKTAFRDAGMREYVLWRTLSAQLDWWKLEGGEFQPLEAGEDGILRSEVFPGLWLDGEAMLRQDSAKVLEVLNQGLASPQHAAFVEKLAQRKET